MLNKFKLLTIILSLIQYIFSDTFTEKKTKLRACVILTRVKMTVDEVIYNN